MTEDAGFRRSTTILASLLLVLHGWQCVRCFDSLRAIMSEDPIVQVDHALHLYHGSVGAKFLREHGVNWGYDPYFLAGYPRTPFHDPSAGLSDFCQLVAGGYSPRAYKLGLFVTMVTTPMLLGLAGRWMGLSRLATLASVAFALLYYWTGFARTLLDTGLYSFLWGSAWALVVLGAFVQWRATPSAVRWAVFALTLSWSLFVHPTVPVLLLVPAGVMYLTSLRKASIRWHAATWFAIILAGLANSFWIGPLIRLWHYRVVHFVFMTADASFVLDYLSDHTLAQIVAALGAIGAFESIRRSNRVLLETLLPTALTNFALTFFGSLWSVTRGLEPRRFEVPWFFALCLFAGIGLERLVRLVASSDREPVGDHRGRPSQRLGSTLAIAILLAIAAWTWRQRLIERGYALIVHHRPFPMRLEPEMLDLVRWIETNTDRSARIMLEDQLRLLEATVPESLHWTTLLPILVQREFIGGHYQVTPLLHQSAAFGDYHVSDRPINEMSPQQLDSFLERYNVGWVICWSPRSRFVFDSFGKAERVGELPRFTTKPTENRYALYRVQRAPSYFAQGKGRVVSADYNRIELADLEPQNDLIVLRYHWLETLASKPAVPLERITDPADPVGFIGIRTARPIASLVIYNSYHWKDR